MKSRSNISNKAQKQIPATKSVIEIKLRLTGDGLWPVFTESEL